MKYSADIKYVIGIDEAGRGPLAGPVSVAVCVVPVKMSRKALLTKVSGSGLKKLKDSKKLSEGRRDEWFVQMQILQKENVINFSVTLISNKIIDEKGISFAIRKAMETSLKKVLAAADLKSSECFLLLDGGLRASTKFIFQKTIIKGDEKEFAISLASIAAKVTRDAHMKKIAKKYPLHNLEIHKGYGTQKHIAAIKKHGPTPIHRQSFLKNIL